MSDEPRQRQCHICQQWVTDYTIDRETLRAGVKSQPICKGCVAYREARPASAMPTEAPYQRGSSSSKAGAQAAAYKVTSQAFRILEELAKEGDNGLTCKQLEFITDIPVNECSRACNQLYAHSPYAKLADFKRPNPGTGVPAQVYVITDAGRAWLKTVTA